eukprot:TRINITY_DN82318_c0_g1_i1.p1 TRINITY_DN82318_c0_g1~~TRINITY_DN82318_c0_g1_i1.p1  ORF type:complete len:549 (+),score=98.22 TRINITY_DN82318_c0_g1_i1:64-1647(+)
MVQQRDAAMAKRSLTVALVLLTLVTFSEAVRVGDANVEESDVRSALWAPPSCESPCGKGDKNPAKTCRCRCGDDLPPLTFDEAQLFVKIEAKLGDADEKAAEVDSWEALCSEVNKNPGLKKSMSALVLADAGQSAVAIVGAWKINLLGFDLKTLNLGSLMGYFAQGLQSAANHANEMKGMQDCIATMKKKLGDGGGLARSGVKVTKDYLGGDCYHMRQALGQIVGDSVGLGALTEVLKNFQEALLDIPNKGTKAISVRSCLFFVNALLAMQPKGMFAKAFLLTSAGFLGPLYTNIRLAGNLKQTAKESVKFVSEVSTQMTLKRVLGNAAARQEALQQCEEEVAQGADAVASGSGCNELAKFREAQPDCGVMVVNSKDANRCDVYGVVSGAPQAGALVKSLGFNTYLQGLRACDVVTRIEYVEGGSFKPLAAMWPDTWGPQKKTIPISSAEDLRRVFGVERSRHNAATQFSPIKYDFEINWRVTVKGFELDVDRLPETHWKEFELPDFKFGSLECRNYNDSSEDDDDE